MKTTTIVLVLVAALLSGCSVVQNVWLPGITPAPTPTTTPKK